MVSSTALLTRMPDSEKESLFSAGVRGGKAGKMSESELHVKEKNGNDFHVIVMRW